MVLKSYQVKVGEITMPEGINCFQLRINPEGEVFYSDVNHEGYADFLKEKKLKAKERAKRIKEKQDAKLQRLAEREANKLKKIADKKAAFEKRKAELDKKIADLN